MKNKISLIAEKIKEGGKNVVFTGAGISTESGIPDYRSQGGIWDKFRPVYLDEFMSSKDSREEYWRRWVALYQGIVEAQPNAAHLALAGLESRGLLSYAPARDGTRRCTLKLEQLLRSAEITRAAIGGS